MLYFANPTKDPRVHELMRTGVLGYIDTPGQGDYRAQCAGGPWCADNGCFNDQRFSEDRWWNWLQRRAAEADTCWFATAPDVLGDAAATLERSRPWLPRIRSLGFPVAFVAQDGIERTDVPWGEFDWLFIGGTTEFKLGPVARRYVVKARRRGKRVHCGRVNSKKRYRYAEAIGCDSADGTFLLKSPSENLPRLMVWLDDLRNRPALFDFREGASA